MKEEEVKKEDEKVEVKSFSMKMVKPKPRPNPFTRNTFVYCKNMTNQVAWRLVANFGSLTDIVLRPSPIKLTAEDTR